MSISAFTYSQNLETTFYKKNPEKPILIINNTIIGSSDLLLKISPKEIKNLEISKNEELSPINLFPVDKITKGMIKVETDLKFDTKTQEELNLFFSLKTSNEIYINGYLIENKAYSISTKSIKKIELMEPNGIGLKISALNITL